MDDRMSQTARWLRKLADRYDGIANGRIAVDDKLAMMEIRMLVEIIKRVLIEDWL
jgi:hypothetical protein